MNQLTTMSLGSVETSVPPSEAEKSAVPRRRLPWTPSEPGKSCVRRVAATLILASLLLMSPGCRTFNTTEEEFQKQQQGVCNESPNEEAAWWCLGELLRLFGPFLSGR